MPDKETTQETIARIRAKIEADYTFLNGAFIAALVLIALYGFFGG